jgi:hypothetical protein
MNLKPWQEIKVDNKIVYFQFFARSNGKDYVVFTDEQKQKDKVYYKYYSVDFDKIIFI